MKTEIDKKEETEIIIERIEKKGEEMKREVPKEACSNSASQEIKSKIKRRGQLIRMKILRNSLKT